MRSGVLRRWPTFIKFSTYHKKAWVATSLIIFSQWGLGYIKTNLFTLFIYIYFVKKQLSRCKEIVFWTFTVKIKAFY